MKIIIAIIKGLMIAVLVIVLAFVVLTILDKTVFKHTPARALKVTFNISLKGFDYSVETFEEQWCPNGDGHALVIYRFNKLTQENIDYLKSFGLKPLPISEEERNIMHFNKISKEYFEVDTGYYIYEPLRTVDFRGNYQVFVLDTENNKAILYYQYM